MIAYGDALLGTGSALSRELADHRKIMAERDPDLLMNAKMTGDGSVWDEPREEALREARSGTPMRYGLRLVIMSDTREQHAGLAVPDGDVLIHAGDFTYNGDVKAIKAFGTWLCVFAASARARHRNGNHDVTFEHVPASRAEGPPPERQTESS
jgi:hypothetical protein